MHTNEPREAPSTDTGYETRDIAIKPIVNVSVGLGLFAIASAIFGWIFLAGLSCGPIKFEGYSSQYSKTYVETKRVMPAEGTPLLQNNISNRADIQELRKAEEARLNGYGYSGPDKTFATIPVADAMKVIESGDGISTGNVVPAETKGNTTDQKKEPAPGAASPKLPSGDAPTAAASAPTTPPAGAGH